MFNVYLFSLIFTWSFSLHELGRLTGVGLLSVSLTDYWHRPLGVP